MEKKHTSMTKEKVMELLHEILDPELHVSIVDLGLIYDVSISPTQTPEGLRDHIHILMTLTTPGCPLAAMFDHMVKDAFKDIPEIDSDRDITIELTFDPPWIIDMMNPETRAHLGL
ncbi:MAG TPA: hypothetical protein DCX25_02050 [Candidatus Pacebacteria bacterium]|nr:MAG: hypothetical protein UX00_C0014G0012 [Microgenomates group bacterium GW2011_GWB1_45_17]KKU23152.1 MAG: hypothetical protein UX35_C0010G0070 [Microgenomates group bacterium GW2011_GWA1_46_15]KKU23815.1 MAG: hypothetical protein UX36_C0003G0115 [Microgenomates group bacterium GW2011_GWC1_46_15]HAV15088.1 hypothetical protein [Candidatus Paceibacterota bacterium]HCR11653.1 hypothetical protein [Candidatus Paceibacterota bacterium]